jgi:membrane protein YqaA with SNARE-associated domain
MAVLIAAALWGFAEATLFFLVPDVILSAVAIVNWRLASWACLAATGGALLGGALMYRAGRRSGPAVRALLLRIPGIGPAMLERVASEVASRRFLAVLLGPLSGTPYKLYAVEAGRRGLPLGGLMLVSIPARMLRFVGVTLLAAWLAHGAFPALPVAAKLVVWGVSWTLFYGWYFAAMRRRGSDRP